VVTVAEAKTPDSDHRLSVLSQVVGAIQHTLSSQQVAPVCLDDVLNTLGRHATDVIHDGIDATLSFGCPLNMVADLITNTSVSVMTSGWDITQANEPLKEYPIHAALSHPMEVSLDCLRVTGREQMGWTTIAVLEPWSNEELFSGVL
jgi:hypothetical protein